MLAKTIKFLSTKHQGLMRFLLVGLFGFFLQLLRLYLGMIVHTQYIVISAFVIAVTCVLLVFVPQKDKAISGILAITINLVVILSILNNIIDDTLPLWGISLLILILAYTYQQLFTLDKLWLPITVVFNAVCVMLLTITPLNTDYNDLVLFSLLLILIGTVVYFSSCWVEQRLIIEDLKQENESLTKKETTVMGKILFKPKSKDGVVKFWIMGLNGPVFVHCNIDLCASCEILKKDVTVTCHGIIGGMFIDTVETRPVTFLLASSVKINLLELP